MAALLQGCFAAGTDWRFNYGLPSASKDTSLQRKLDSLVIGSSDFDQVQSQIGQPERVRDLAKFRVYWRPWVSMQTQRADYPGLGVSVTMLTNPSRLYAVTVETPDVSVRSLRVGQTLEDVKRAMQGEAWWWSSDGDGLFWLDYDHLGVRFAFARDPSRPKYPMALATPQTVIKIECYDRTVEFFEGWVNFRFFAAPPIIK